MNTNHHLAAAATALAMIAAGGFTATVPDDTNDVTAATTEPAPEPGAVEILPPDEPYGGATLAEWIARSWQWSANLPEGFDCNYGQNGPVFFMPGGSDYDCVVPEGTAIFMVADGNICSSAWPEPNFGRDEEDLRACLDEVGHMTGATVTINGQEVADFDASRSTTTPVYNLYVPEYSVWADAPRGASLAMNVGTAFVIAPPPPGDYQIVLTDMTGFSFTINVTVVAPQIN
jgi:hypothetical protein